MHGPLRGWMADEHDRRARAAREGGCFRRMDDDGRHTTSLQSRRRDRYILPAPRGLESAGRTRPHRDGRTQGLHGRGRNRRPALSSPRTKGSHAPDRRSVPLGRISRSFSELRTGQAPLLRSGHSRGSTGLVQQTPRVADEHDRRARAAREGGCFRRMDDDGRHATGLQSRPARSSTFCLLPGVWDRLDVPDLIAMAAPRACMVVGGTRRPAAFPPLGRPRRKPRARSPNALDWAGSADRFRSYAPAKPHCYDRDIQEEALGWFNKHLKAGKESLVRDNHHEENENGRCCYEGSSAKHRRLNTQPGAGCRRSASTVSGNRAGLTLRSDSPRSIGQPMRPTRARAADRMDG